MTDYEMVLLARAEDFRAAHAPAQLTLLTGWAQMLTAEDCWEARGDTLADALTALLDDLGEDVPEAPSAEQIVFAPERDALARRVEALEELAAHRLAAVDAAFAEKLSAEARASRLREFIDDNRNAIRVGIRYVDGLAAERKFETFLVETFSGDEARTP